MSAPFVRFERLEIRSLPGLPAPGLVLDALSSGVNVIYGPNASGKSRTAHALLLLLWPRDSRRERAILRGRLRLDGDDRWIIGVDAGAVSCQRAGQDAELPPLPPHKTRERYRLELHDLVGGRGQSFAEGIALETVGGYDLHRASDDLGFRAGAPSSRKETGLLQERQETLRQAREHHAALLDEERRLGPLRRERLLAHDGRRRAAALALAVERAGLIEPLEDAQATLAAFPARMDRVAGDEATRLGALRNSIKILAAEQRDAAADIEEARGKIAASTLPEGGLPPGTIRELRDHLPDLLRAEQTVETQHGNLAKARAARNQARGRIGKVTDEQLAQLDLGALEDLSAFARRSQEHHARLESAEALRNWLGQGTPDPQLNAVQQGIDLLRRWLGSQAPPPIALDPLWKGLLTVAGVVTVAAVIASATTLGWWLLIFAPVGLIPVIHAWRPPPAPPSVQDIHRRDYADLDLEEPKSWDEAGVRRRLARLEGRQARAKIEQERELHWQRKQAEIEELAGQQAEFDRQREEMAERLGVDPGTDGQSLRWLVTNLIAWEAAATDADVARAELMEANARRGKSTAAINGLLEPLGFDAVEDATAAGRAIDILEERVGKLRQATSITESSGEMLHAFESQLFDRQAELRALFENAGLEPGDDAALADRCQRRAAWVTARDSAATLRHDLERAEQKLREHPGFDAGHLTSPPDELQDELVALATAEDDERAAHDQIVRIEHDIAQAKQAHGVEAALAAMVDAEAALAERRAEDRLAVAGDVLGDWLYQRSRDRDRPAVFHRARELLLAITRGRYRLDIEDGRPPRFRAYDTVREQGLELDQLSSGTRAQLLLAVRVAFVETQEQGARPPLVLDETLANSDDARARAIIEATLELARAGRQVFYFTAQHDEVGKWCTVLGETADVEHKLFDLTEVRQLSRAESVDELPRVPIPDTAVQPPAGHDHEAYGRALKVLPIDPRAPLGAVHLWHLLCDPQALHHLLQAGIDRWGPLQQLLSAGGAPLLGDDPDGSRRMEAAARAVGAVCAEWRVGRGQPVDRQALIDSGAVTPRPLPEVAALAAEVGGDARALLARLEAEKVPGLGAKGLQRVRERLLEHGYLAAEEPQSRTAIRARALGTVAQEISAGLVDAAFIDRILQNLTEPP